MESEPEAQCKRLLWLEEIQFWQTPYQKFDIFAQNITFFLSQSARAFMVLFIKISHNTLSEKFQDWTSCWQSEKHKPNQSLPISIKCKLVCATEDYQYRKLDWLTMEFRLSWNSFTVEWKEICECGRYRGACWFINWTRRFASNWSD